MEKRRPGRRDYSGLECRSSRVQWGEGGRGGGGDIDSVALTTALAADQVKEGGRVPTDCSRKTKNREKKYIGGMEKD